MLLFYKTLINMPGVVWEKERVVAEKAQSTQLKPSLRDEDAISFQENYKVPELVTFPHISYVAVKYFKMTQDLLLTNLQP